MDSIGEKLRNAREARRLTYKDASKETNIPHKYIEALEEEDFDVFPGETYIIGFLRSYAEFLRLDADELIQAYKGYKIGESTTPLEELTKPTRSPMMISLSTLYHKNKNYIYIGGIAVSILLIIVVFSSIFSSKIRVNESDKLSDIKNESDKNKKKAYLGNYNKLILRNGVGYAIVSRNEGVFFSVDEREAMFILRDIKDKDSVVLEISPGNMMETIIKETPKTIAIKGCPREVEFTLKALAENSANIKVVLGNRIEEEVQEKQEVEHKVEGAAKVIARNEKNLNIIFDADFTQKSFVEVYLDGMLKKRGMVREGTKEKWEASSHIQVRIGNAGGVKVKINGTDYNWGGPGVVVNKVVTWKKDPANPNVYHLNVKDW